MRAQTSPEILAAAANLAAAGFSITGIARHLNIGRASLRRAEERGQICLKAAGSKPLPPPEPDDTIPAWITDEIVREDYVEARRMYGEAVALREARQGMKAVREGWL